MSNSDIDSIHLQTIYDSDTHTFHSLIINAKHYINVNVHSLFRLTCHVNYIMIQKIVVQS